MTDLGVRIVRAQAYYSASRFHEDGVDLNVSHAEFAELIEQVKAVAWDEVADNLGEYAEVDDSLIHLADNIRDGNPYRTDLMEGDQ